VCPSRTEQTVGAEIKNNRVRGARLNEGQKDTWAPKFRKIACAARRACMVIKFSGAQQGVEGRCHMQDKRGESCFMLLSILAMQHNPDG
jgi:hypothetical protein